LEDFFENAPTGSHWFASDGNILRVNRAELEMLGYLRDEFVGHHISEFHSDAEVVANMLRRLHAGEEVRNYPARLRCKDGSKREALIDANVLWEDGKFVHSRCFVRDATDRNAVDETRSRLADIVESSQDAIISKTIDSRIVSWNRGAACLFGYSADEAIGKPITILIPPERHDEERLIIGQLKRGERIEHYETIRITKQGQRIEVSETISPIRDRTGRIVGASKIARDITARRQAERTAGFLARASAALSERIDYLSMLHKIASLAVPLFADWCAVDLLEPDGAIRRVAQTHSANAKVELSECLDGNNRTLASVPCNADQVIRAGELAWVAQIPDELWMPVAQDDAKGRPIRSLKLKSFICVPLKTSGQVLGALTFATAESARSYDYDHAQAAQDLAHRAAIAIENGRLLKALQDSDRRKDEFLAMLAHELRNPLAPIRNAVEIFRAAGAPTPELEWVLGVIGRQVHQMTRLVDDLLDVSRISRGTFELRKERVAMQSVVDGAVEASRPLIDTHAHELIVDIPQTSFYLDGDPTRLSQVIMNLLNNSAKYMDSPGRIWLTVVRDQDQIVIRVKDTGNGIPRDMLPHVFDMFTQVDKSLERTQGGLGIGLTLVKHVVELHGGTIEAHSEGPGHGSEFIVRLPAARDQQAESQNGSGAIAIRQPQPKRRILVVDDNQDSAISLSMLLRLLGNEVQTAYDGLEAVAAATEFKPDVVLMDIGLPKMNGYEVARRIRGKLGGGVMLVALTGWGQDRDRRRSQQSGFDHHLTKPVEFAVLQALLAEPQCATA
jgi:PAS domain S-box-containing protein